MRSPGIAAADSFDPWRPCTFLSLRLRGRAASGVKAMVAYEGNVRGPSHRPSLAAMGNAAADLWPLLGAGRLAARAG